MKARDRILSWATLLCCIAGAALGLVRPDLAEKIRPVGTAYVAALKYLALPALTLSVFVSAGKGGQKAAGILARALILFVILFSTTFLLSAALYSAFSPGKAFYLMGETPWQGEEVSVSLGGILKNIFAPESVSVNSLFFPCFLAAFAAGILSAVFKLDRIRQGAEALERLFQRLLSFVMLLTPLGVFSLMAASAAALGSDALKTAGAYVLWAYGGCLLAMAAVMILPLWIWCRVDPGTYFARTGRMYLTAISTCSSAATLPETTRTCREGFHVPDEITGIVVPLGCTVHMCGGAVSFCLLGLFVLQMTGRPVSFGTLIVMLLIAILLNMAAPGIPGGGIVLGCTYLAMLGVDHVELFLGMYAGIYRLLDMAYTSLNVAGDVTANILIDRWGKKR